MKKIFIGAMLLASMSAFAQETYENANLFETDLTGTARYVGMGGAMEALGADISTISSNPAGVGLFRRSVANMTVGLSSQVDCGESQYVDATNVNFNQIGVVWSNQIDNNRFLNFGFNYHKSKDFKNILNVGGTLDDASQNKLSYFKCMTAGSKDDLDVSQLDLLYYNAFILDVDDNVGFNIADRYDMKRGTKGSINEYDFNVSGNLNNKLYLGFTLGMHDVDFSQYSSYTESLLNLANQNIGTVTVNDERVVTGMGVDMKFGAIFYPIEGSPLRLGASIATPTWYSLRTENYTSLTNNANVGFTAKDPNYVSKDSYDYRVYTPWKFGLSAGTTISNFAAVGLSYEYADYSSTRSRVIEYDYAYDESSYNDVSMNSNTNKALRGVSTLKVGTEVKPVPEVAVRLGYNYVAPAFRSEGYKDPLCYSYGTYVASQTDYTNWKATNRLTCGVGYSKGSFSADLAYQFSATKGEFHPFADVYGDIHWSDGDIEMIDNYADAVEVKNNRHQIIATLTYKF